MNYAHTCIRVNDLEASVAFYEKALGYRVTRTKDPATDGSKLVFMALEGDSTELELTYKEGRGPYDVGNGYGHMALLTDDLEGEHARLKAEGFDVSEMRGVPGEPPLCFFVTDPDGYQTEIVRR